MTNLCTYRAKIAITANTANANTSNTANTVNSVNTANTANPEPSKIRHKLLYLVLRCFTKPFIVQCISPLQ